MTTDREIGYRDPCRTETGGGVDVTVTRTEEEREAEFERQRAELRTRFVEAVSYLFQERVSKRLSRILGMHQRQVQYLLKGEIEPDPSMVRFLEEQRALVEKTGVARQIWNAVTHAQDMGVDREVLMAILAETYERKFDRSID